MCKGAIFLARPEGFEPPTPRSVVRHDADSQKTGWHKGGTFEAIRVSPSIPFRAVSAQSGSKVVAERELAHAGFSIDDRRGYPCFCHHQKFSALMPLRKQESLKSTARYNE